MDISEVGTPLDIAMFDQIVTAVFSPQGAGFEQAHEQLLKFQNRPDAWLMVQHIIMGTQLERSRFLALETFIKGAQSDWGKLDESQRLFFKQFFFNLVIEWSVNALSETMLNTANKALIEVLKNEWPTFWPNFMHDFLMATKNNVNAAINSLNFLTMLSEETHEYSDELLTTDRMSELSRALENDFNLIFSHLEQIFLHSTDINLISRTLLTLSHYLKWIDLQKVTSTTMCQQLVTNLFPNENFRYPVLCCFDAIATHISATADASMSQIFALFVRNIRITLSENNDINEVYKEDLMVKKLVQTIGDFLLLDQSSLLQGILTESATYALIWLAQLTAVAEGDTFKIAVDNWFELTRLFFLEHYKVRPPRELIYQLQEIFVVRMAKPPELYPLIEQDISDVQESDLFVSMRQTIVCLSNLDKENMSQVLVNNLRSPNKMNILSACFSIGAISGTFSVDQEKAFLSHCLDILFTYLSSDLQEDERMILSGCYLFICSTYPRFLSSNWNYLKQLTDKIAQMLQMRSFKLQEVTVKIFQIVAKWVPKPLMTIHQGQAKSVCTEFVENLNLLCSNLKFEYVPILYQTLAQLCGCAQTQEVKTKLAAQLLVLPMNSWNDSLKRISVDSTIDDQITIQLIFALDIFTKIIQIPEVCPLFYPQVEQIISHSLGLYQFTTGQINQHGINQYVWRTKDAILCFFEGFFGSYQQSPLIPRLVELLITDYYQSQPDCRHHQIIDCFTTLIERIGPNSHPFVETIVNNVVSPTYQMICETFDTYPEIRLSHFKLLSSLMTKIFASVQSFDQGVFTMMLDCLLWGVKHPKNDISSLALNCVSDCLQKIAQNEDEEFRRVFYDQFYLKIVFELFNVMTDRIHKFIFTPLAQTLDHLFLLVRVRCIFLNGCETTDSFVADSLTEKLVIDFPHIQKSIILEFSRALITEAQNFGNFKEQLRNFLIQIKKVVPSDRCRAEIIEESKDIIGILGPAEPTEEDDGMIEF